MFARVIMEVSQSHCITFKYVDMYMYVRTCVRVAITKLNVYYMLFFSCTGCKALALV